MNRCNCVLIERDIGHLFRDILIAGSAEEGKGQQEHICSSVAQRPKPVVILLSWIYWSHNKLGKLGIIMTIWVIKEFNFNNIQF